jgi:glycosyltransferase involved in cell wall biosynthesis
MHGSNLAKDLSKRNYAGKIIVISFRTNQIGIIIKTALLHHWLNGMRGGEKVFEIFCDLYPDADVFTLFYSPDLVSERIKSHKVTSSSLNRYSLFRKSYTNLFMLFPFITEQFDVTSYDLLLSSDTISMKGVISSPDSCHISYCHTPPRYVWDKYFEYLDNAGLGKLKRMMAELFLHRYRQWDAIAANRVDYFIANSNYVARRIAKTYRRKAVVVNPPVNMKQFSIGEPEDFYLSFGQLVPYKRIDILVDAFNEMPSRRLKIVGGGSLFDKLKNRAKGNIEFIGWVSEMDKAALFQKCKAFLFPGAEDYGITPLEAQASGRPVIAFGAGGVNDTVKGLTIAGNDRFDPDNHTGVFFKEQTKSAVIQAIEFFEQTMERSVLPQKIRDHAGHYDIPVFESRIQSVIHQYMNDFKRNGPPVFDNLEREQKCLLL